MSHPQSNKGRIVAALFLIGFGLLFLFGNMGVFHIGDVFSDYWPLILVAIGVSRLTSGGKDLGGALFFIGLGLLFLASNLHLLSGDMFDYWPLILVLLGVWILFKPRGTHSKSEGKFKHHGKHPEGIQEESDKDGWISIVTIFGGQERPIQSLDFKGGEVTSIFAGGKLDLRQVRTARSELHVEITAIFSGLDIIIPPEWQLDLSITPMFGSVEDKRRNLLHETIGEAPRLYLHGSSIFSGIEITS